LAIIVPISLLCLYEIWVVLFIIVIWDAVDEQTAQLILVITYSLLGTAVRGIISFAIDRIEKERNFEIPTTILIYYLTEALITAFYRYILWIT